METASLYVAIGSSCTSPLPPVTSEGTADGANDSDGRVYGDVLSPSEKEQFNDEEDMVIATRRDPDSSSAVRVASMDYFVPDKLPQPRNLLESLVWERDKDLDRLREKVPLPRALSLAKLGAKKYPQRSLHEAINNVVARNTGSTTIPPVLLLACRSSPNNRPSTDSGGISTDLTEQLRAITSSSQGGRIAAIGCQVDSSSFGGSYEDLETLRKSTADLPVVCEDIVLFGYQLFRAKAAGADAVRLFASVLPSKDLVLLSKTAKALGLSVIVVVSSKGQLLQVLAQMPPECVDAVSVTSRNMRVWKVQCMCSIIYIYISDFAMQIDEGKADKILQAREVVQAIADFKTRQPDQTASRLLIFQEGFASKAELSRAQFNGCYYVMLLSHDLYSSDLSSGVDAIILSEELLRPAEVLVEASSASLSSAAQWWLS